MVASAAGTRIVRRMGKQDVLGVVVDAAGTPIPDAKVFKTDGPTVQTDEKGQFHLKVDKGTQFILNVYAPGYHVWFGTPTSGDVLKIVLEPKPAAEAPGAAALIHAFLARQLAEKLLAATQQLAATQR